MAANDLASLVVKTELINTGFVGPMRENTRAAQQFQREMGKSAAAGQAGSKSMSRFGVITQQAGYQAQDFAVQVAGGQSAMVAMAQQGSQMLGVFGPAGAIAGAILAVGVLVARISGVGESSKKSAEEVRDLRDAYRELELARGGGKEAELTHKKEDLEESVEAYAKAAEEIEKAKKRLESLKKMMVDFMQAGVSDPYTINAQSVAIVMAEQKVKSLQKAWEEMEAPVVRSLSEMEKAAESLSEEQTKAKEKLLDEVVRANDEIARSNATLLSDELKNTIQIGQARADQARKWAAIKKEIERKAEEERLADAQQRLLQQQLIDAEIDAEIEAQKKLAQSIREVIDPTLKLAKAREIAQALVAGGYLDQNEVEPYIAKLSEVKEKIDSFTQEMNSMWNSVSDRAGQAFADMVLTGENAFDQLADIVARSMLEIVTRMAIINPLLNSLFNFSGTSILTAFYGRGAIAGSASGGNFSAGDVKLVGENGPELFTSDRAGTIHQAGATRGMMRGDKSGGDVFNISYSFAAGVTHRELAQMIPALINQTKSSILDARARGASA